MGLLFNIQSIPAADAERLIAGDHAGLVGTVSSVSLEKAWGGIHFLISGASTSNPEQESPAHFLINGFLFEDAAEHVAFHTAEQVRKFAGLLDACSDAELLQRFNAEEMNRLNVYGEPWNPSMKDYIAQFLPDLRDFISKAVSENCGTVTVIG